MVGTGALDSPDMSTPSRSYPPESNPNKQAEHIEQCGFEPEDPMMATISLMMLRSIPFSTGNVPPARGYDFSIPRNASMPRR